MARRVVRDRGAVLKLFDELAPRYLARRGGYTRIVKLGQRPGDAAPMSLLELIPDEAPAAAPTGDKGAKGKGGKAAPAGKSVEKQADGGAKAVKNKAAAVLKADRDEAGESKGAGKKKAAAKAPDKAKSKKDE
jgi:large subunit ribosomal protein L17